MRDKTLEGRLSALSTRIEVFITPIYKAMAVLAAIAGAMIVVLTGASVTMRYFASAPFSFTEELVGLLMTAAFFLALPLVTLRSQHVRVLLLVSSLPLRVGRGIEVMAAFFGVIFCLWFFWLCLPWLEFAVDRRIKTEVGRMLLYPWMGLLPLSMVFTALAFIVRGASGDRGRVEESLRKG